MRTGPIGVAMEIMTWCAVLGTGRVITACVEAVLWQRTAPTDTVLQARTAAGPGHYCPIASLRSASLKPSSSFPAARALVTIAVVDP